MANVTKILSDEHINILKVVGALQKESKAISNGKAVDKKFFEDAIDFIRNYADKFHHAKEEDILFKELNKDSVEMHCNPTEQMLFEHEIGRGHVKTMENGVKNGDKEEIIEGARGYAELLTEHIYKEDNILYPMAEESLDEKTKKGILVKYEKAEQKRFEKGVKERYIKLAKEFERRK